MNWKGKWIGLDWKRDIKPVGGIPIAFRKDFELTGYPAVAEIKVSASRYYALWINGEICLYGPARCFPNHQSYDVLDITSFLKAGRNSIAVVVLPLSAATGTCKISRIGFILDGEVLCNNEKCYIHTDNTWKVRVADWYEPMELYTSLSAGMQEHFQGNKEVPGWRTEAVDTDWENAWCIGPVGTPPWKLMIARSIPLLKEKIYKASLVWVGIASKEIRDIRDNLAIHFNSETINGSSVGGYNAEWIEPNEKNVFVFDFGKTMFIRPGIELKEICGKLRLEIYYSLKLEEKPNAMRGFDSIDEGFVDSITPAQGNTKWEAIYPRGFRFMTIKIVGNGTGKFRLMAKTVDYPYKDSVSVECNNQLLKNIWRISAETLKSSTNDVIVDTCSRENNLWTLDACVSAKAAFYTFGETRMWRRCLDLIGEGIDEDGIPKSIVPTEYTYMCMFDQAMYWVTSCYDYYRATGDMNLLKGISGAVKRFVALCIKYMTSENLFVPPEFSWHWVDWAPIDKRPYSLPVNCLLVLALNAADKIGREVGDIDFSNLSLKVGKKLKKAIGRFYDEKAGAFLANTPTAVPVEDGNPMNYYGLEDGVLLYNIHGNSLACLAGCGTAKQRKSAARFVAKSLEEPLSSRNKFGPGWTEIILSPLFDYGYGKQAVEFIYKTYGAFIEAGAPTWGEEFNCDKFNTAHGWGASVNTLIAERIIKSV